MHEFRIAIGLLACTAAWVAIAPAAPTLVSFASSRAPSVEIGSLDLPTTDVEPVPAPPVAAAPVATPNVQATDLSSQAPTSDATSPVELAGRPPETDAQVEFQLFNRPVAVDAGTLKVGRTTLRVADVEPIEPDARCTDGAQSWPCGIRARTAFRSWLRGRSVLCAVPADQRDAVDLTVSCLAGEADIGEWLVRNGWAVPANTDRYAAMAETAKAERRGVYAFGVAP